MAPTQLRSLLPLAAAVFLAACSAPREDTPSASSAPRELSPFDGVSLAGWTGDARFWSVRDGAIVGESSAQNPCDATNYLVWRGGEVGDFELELEYRITGGNSGVQFRSSEPTPGDLAGYQADIEDGPSWSGCIYEQGGRGVVATRGERVLLTADGRQAVRLESAAELQHAVRRGGWNHYVVRARGEHLELELNGVRMVELVDSDATKRRERGLLGLQLHAGPPMRVEFRDLRLRELEPAARSSTLITGALAFDGAPPQWIWLADQAHEKEVATFRRELALDSRPKRAVLRAAADDHVRVFVNGELALEHDDWRTCAQRDVAQLLHPGANVLAIAARNDSGPAATWMELVVELADGRRTRIVSDARFAAQRAGAEYERWTPADFDPARAAGAHELGSYGCEPWAAGIGGATSAQVQPALDPSALELPSGFQSELVYRVPKATQGSWVSLAIDPRGRLYASDQEGGIFRVTLREAGQNAPPLVEPLAIDLGRAHGLCWAFDALYVVVSEGGGRAPGVYRVRDTNGDDALDAVELLRAFDGSGEHGPHAIVTGPPGDDGLWIVAGNFTKLPELARSRVPRTWAEDELLPHLDDPNGHDPHIHAPGGWVCRIDRDAKEWELVAAGLRNAYDLAFGPDGELFTYDSDMEWDIGAPWYRPTRVLHVVSGADFGWRNGSAKWSASWPDTLPSVIDLGLGSPTGITFATNARFPKKWRRALFACDWAYGTIHAVFLDARGASFGATSEVFARGKPFPIADVVVGADGALYALTGGRGTESGLYRISWTGPVDEADQAGEADDAGDARDAAIAEARPLRERRRAHEIRHLAFDAPAASAMSATDGAESVEFLPAPAVCAVTKSAFGYPEREAEDLRSPDPFLRHAARIAVERANVERLTTPPGEVASIARLVAQVHRARPSAHATVWKEIAALDLEHASESDAIEAARVIQLAVLRLGEIGAEERETLARRVRGLFASSSGVARDEWARLLGGLRDAKSIDVLLAELEHAQEQERRIHLAHCLLGVNDGWAEEQRTRFFAAVDALLHDAKGGASLVKFVERIRSDALGQVPEAERTAFARKQAISASDAAPAPLVHAWTAREIEVAFDPARDSNGSADGRAAFEKARCLTCHRIDGAGGDTGPDLTGAGARFTRKDLIEALLEPSKVISDQFRDVEVATKDGDFHVGRIEREDARTLVLRSLPPREATIEIEKSAIEERRLSALSSMPAGLLDVLDGAEIVALFEYVLADRRR